MSGRSLFFDVECANCFGGVGKMCSFGYVVADADFGVVERDDIVMNPESEFDWYLLKDGGTSLAYPKEHFLAQPNFREFHARIYSLVSGAERVFAFGALNDVGFVVTACERYSLPVPVFRAWDVERFCKTDEVFGPLERRCEILGLDNSDLTAHKSSDDALMTMRLLSAFLRREGLSVEDMASRGGACFSVADFLRKREARMRRKERAARRGGGGRGGRGGRRSDSRTIRFD